VFPEPAGDSITDRGVFLTCLALLANRSIISDSKQGYMLPCNVFGLGERRRLANNRISMLGLRDC